MQEINTGIQDRANHLESIRESALQALIKAENDYTNFHTKNELPQTSSISRHPRFKEYSASVDQILASTRKLPADLSTNKDIVVIGTKGSETTTVTTCEASKEALVNLIAGLVSRDYDHLSLMYLKGLSLSTSLPQSASEISTCIDSVLAEFTNSQKRRAM